MAKKHWRSLSYIRLIQTADLSQTVLEQSAHVLAVYLPILVHVSVSNLFFRQLPLFQAILEKHADILSVNLPILINIAGSNCPRIF